MQQSLVFIASNRRPLRLGGEYACFRNGNEPDVIADFTDEKAKDRARQAGQAQQPENTDFGSTLLKPVRTRELRLGAYGSQVFSDAAESAIVEFAEQQAGEKADPTRLGFIKVKRFAEPMPADNWFEIPGGISYVLRDAPESVYTRSGSDSRRVLTRVARGDHAQLLRCCAIENPTVRDLEALTGAASNALDSLSLLEPIY